jgi:2-polyprenyl-6-methoxyphenol hydroxylase-like FAD-dependent oxidoreductase
VTTSSTGSTADVATSPVLVVGAGPVGLTAALMLARHGTAVRIIDRDAGPTDLSKALVVWQRTMETLGPVLPHERFSAGHPVLERVVLALGAGRRHDVEFPSPVGAGVPPCVMVPQSATERILIDRLADFGIRVERQTELTGVQADDNGVSCEIRGPSGTAQVRTPWLVACDGAHSVARKGLDLSFPGETVSQRWLLADFDVAADLSSAAFSSSTDRPSADRSSTGRSSTDRSSADTSSIEPRSTDLRSDERHIQIDLTHGIAALFPLGSGRWRLIADHGAGGEEGELGKLSGEEVQAVLDSHTDLGWKIATMHWSSEFGVNERQVEQYVHGRVVLAGDAAHVHSPAGGQGMNTGMQDAANLAWKIALVQRGAVSASLLATYQAERHPVGAAVVRQSGLLLKAAMATGPLRFARNHLAPIALSIPQLQRQFVAFLTEEAVSYRHGPLADGSGHRHGARSGEVWPLSPGAQAELILLGDAARDEAPETFGGPNGFPLTVTRVDPDGRRAVALGQDSGAVLVRPDGVVASVGADAATAMAWFSQHLQVAGAAEGRR